ncbi:class I SAM-dependent methyltransferase [Deinococcus aestuarii]|uniref:class I SAM-dependent methyltransferase n=1 Tax=Deinococcus aestuarii TaxID=2774531 RepID=UPI001C0D7820|nr:class I SAM-dependent methyltransferase [Deinococcus aestuarii]
MGGSLARRDTAAHELMDDAGCDPQQLRNTYVQFRVVNAVLSGWGRVYRQEIRPHLHPERPRTLLDVGSGGGDVPRAFATWARRDGLALDVLGIDADPRAVAFARELPPMPGVQFRQVLSGDLVREGRRFDFVTSNHLLHHLTADELAMLLHDSERLCAVKVLHSDLERHPWAYRLFSVAARPFPHSFIREDGLTSIRRSYTRAELQATVPPGWQVRPLFPFRHLLTYVA